MEAGSEAQGLRGGFCPQNGEFLLLLDSTLSRDSTVISDVMLAARLRAEKPLSRNELVQKPSVVLVAAHLSPTSHATMLRKLGVSIRDLSDMRTVDSRASLVLDEHVAVGGTVSVDSERSLLGLLSEIVKADSLIVVDNANALRLGVESDVCAIVRLALSRGASVVVAADDIDQTTTVFPPRDSQTITSLEDLADVIVHVTPLLSDTDYNGRVSIHKRNGLWCRSLESPSIAANNAHNTDPVPYSALDNDASSFLYKITESSVKYFR